MGKIGYVYLSKNSEYVREQIVAIQKYNVTNIILNELDIDTLKAGDELFIYELKSLRKTVIQLGVFIAELKKKALISSLLKKKIS